MQPESRGKPVLVDVFYIMCLIFTDGLQLLPPVTTIRSNTDICNDSSNRSSKVGLCKYTNEVSLLIMYTGRYNLSTVDAISVLILSDPQPEREQLVVAYSIAIPLLLPLRIPQTSVSQWYLTIDISLKSYTCSLGWLASLLVSVTSFNRSQCLPLMQPVATISTKFLLTHFSISTGFEIFRDSLVLGDVGFCKPDKIFLIKN